MWMPAAESEGLGVHALQLVAHVMEGTRLTVAQRRMIVAQADLPAHNERVRLRRLPRRLTLCRLQLRPRHSERVFVGRAIHTLPRMVRLGRCAQLQRARLFVPHPPEELIRLDKEAAQILRDLRPTAALFDGVLKDHLNLFFCVPSQIPHAAGKIQPVTLLFAHKGIGRRQPTALRGIDSETVAQHPVSGGRIQLRLHACLEYLLAERPLPPDAIQEEPVQAVGHHTQHAFHLTVGCVVALEKEVVLLLLDGTAHGRQGERL